MKLARLSKHTLLCVESISFISVEKKQGHIGPATLSTKLIVDGQAITISSEETEVLLKLLGESYE